MAENVMEAMMKESARVQQKLLKGFENMVHIKDLEDGVTPREVVYREDKIEVYHYKPEGESVCPIPLLICYALVNRQYMMDIQDNLSLFRKLIGQGLDLYVIDWGYPSKMDKYQTMEDYIDGYLNNVVDFVRERTGSDKINLLGVCQGVPFPPFTPPFTRKRSRTSSSWLHRLISTRRMGSFRSGRNPSMWT